MSRSQGVMAWGLGIFCFGLYLATAGPSLVPYRDAGEMAASLPTLGILHPTSYPLYSVVGRLAAALPLANPAYRLNIFSGLCLAGAWSLLALFLAPRFGRMAALATAALGAVSYQFWAHALVSEMYALNILLLAAILLAIDRDQRALAGLLLGLGLANRSDLLLTVPAFACFLAGQRLGSGPGRLGPDPSPGRLFFCLLIGMGLYLYLPLRALQQPWLNWNDPSTPQALMRTLLRSGYGGLLDLLSTAYTTGENFLAELQLYLRHLWSDFFFVGLPLAGLGLTALARKERPLAWTVAVGWLVTGPVFIFLGNLPANPHAVAIVEAGYLNPDFFFLIAAGAGIGALSAAGVWGTWRLPAIGIGLAAAIGALSTWDTVSRRLNFFAVDFLQNVRRSAPPEALVVGRSDVPLFALYYAHWAEPGDRTRIPIGQALSGALWYQRMIKRSYPDVTVSRVLQTDEWNLFTQLNAARPIYATLDLERDSDAGWEPAGLLLRRAKPGQPPPALTSEDQFALYPQRGVYKVTRHRDFFSQELIGEYANARMAAALEKIRRGDAAAAEADLQRAAAMDPSLPQAPLNLAFLAYKRGDLPKAERYGAWAVEAFETMHRNAYAWNALPAARQSVARGLGEAYIQQGSFLKIANRRAPAEEHFLKALELDPRSADARFNLAVLYWADRAWDKVVEQLQAMAAAHPEDPRWKPYLPKALEQLKNRQ